MPLIALDHVNIRTPRLEALTEFYADVLGLERGPRPPFPYPGQWLYCGGVAVLHLVAADAPAEARRTGLEHFALRARGLAPMLARLRERGVPHRVGVVPEWGLHQVHVTDPDGNHVELSFAADDPLPPQSGSPA